MKYNIIGHKYLTDLIDAVQVKIEQGWRPVGGAFCDEHHVYQTMILIEPEPEPPKPTTEELVKMAMTSMVNDPEMPPTSTAQQP